MDLENTANNIFHRWKIALRGKDRSKANISSNFSELVEEWISNSVPYDIAFSIFRLAVLEHYPSRDVVKNVYKRVKKMNNFSMSEDEYAKDWQKMIETEAYNVFYSLYPSTSKKTNIASIAASKTIITPVNNVEYMRQLEHASSFPEVDVNKAIEKRKNITNSFSDIFGDL